ncbi:MAG: acetoacetate decarboxylase family protein [Proteobacteria bacterium]|nr:acetoacetate decarboxylase family protein [Pseudomonadota bacterium]
MGLQGKLTKDKMASTMPADAPAYQEMPFHFRKARMLRFDYETDAEAAAELIPEQLSLTDPPMASLYLNDYPWSTLGPYREAVLAVSVMYGEKNYQYLSHLILNANAPILVGREIYGFPKKMGRIEFVQEDDLMAAYVERPKGIRICSGVLRPEQPVGPVPDGIALETCGLRIVPSPEKGRKHSLVELIQTDMVLSSAEVWTGPGNCHFPGESLLDPWHRLPVRNMIAATYSVCDFILPEGKILETI